MRCRLYTNTDNRLIKVFYLYTMYRISRSEAQKGTAIIMDHENRRKLRDNYMQRKVTGGVFLLENTSNGRCMLITANEIAGMRNRFEFAKKTKSAFHPKLTDWGDGSSFSFTLLDELERKEDCSTRDFQEQLKVLTELWRDNLGDRDWY